MRGVARRRVFGAGASNQSGTGWGSGNLTVFAPNQPGNHSVVFETPFSGTISHNGSIAATTGSSWYSFSNQAADRLVQDAAFDDWFSPSGAARFLYPTGLAAGDGPGGILGRDSATQYDEMYGCQLVRTGTLGGGFEMQGIGVKLYGQVGVGISTADFTNDRRTNELIAITVGPGAGATGVVSDWQLNWQQQNPGPTSRNFSQNRSTVRIQAGVTTLIEWFGAINTVDVANGVFRAWTNGTLTHEYTDVLWRTTAKPVKFYGVKVDPIWGGTGGAARTRDDYHWLGHYRVTGRNL